MANDITVHADQPAGLVPASAQDAFLQMIERASKDPSVDLTKLEKLLEMRDRELARRTAQEFREAMAACQAELDPVRTNASNPQTHSRYANLCAVDQATRPAYTRHGFSLSFNSGETQREGYIRVICTVAHAAGYAQDYFIDMPVDGKGLRGNANMSATHSVASGISYARRYLLCMIWGLATTNDDDDGNAAGGYRQQQAPRPVQAPPSAFSVLRESLLGSHTVSALGEWAEACKARIKALPGEQQEQLRGIYRGRLADLRQREADDFGQPAEAAE